MSSARAQCRLVTVLLVAGCAARSGHAPATQPQAAGSEAPQATASAPAAAQGDSFCAQLQSLVSWQVAHAAEADATAVLQETAQRYAAMQRVAPAAYRGVTAYFARYAAEPSAKAAQEPGFKEQSALLTQALQSCHVTVPQG